MFRYHGVDNDKLLPLLTRSWKLFLQGTLSCFSAGGLNEFLSFQWNLALLYCSVMSLCVWNSALTVGEKCYFYRERLFCKDKSSVILFFFFFLVIHLHFKVKLSSDVAWSNC